MTQAAKAQEPSMEEILASIRRIIADDDTAKPPEPKPAPAAVAPPAPRPAPQPVPAPAPAPVAAAPVLPTNPRDADAVLADLESEALKSAAQAEPDVLDLTEAMAAPPAAASPGFRTIEAQSDVVFSDRPMHASEQPRMHEEPRRMAAPAPSVPDFSLMSAATSAAVDGAFNSLANTILGNNARTLEDLVKEMMRPMLKSWLDDNLPSLVERIVRAEIERVSRGRM